MRAGVTILADTSVWLDHFRSADPVLEALVVRRLVICHPLVIGELSVGNLIDRQATLRRFDKLNQAVAASHADTRLLVEDKDLSGRGLGYIDAMLLASVLITPGAWLWTHDRRLAAVAAALGVGYVPANDA